eukprot:9185056-Ditylum_brightwellii.AAC.1
METAARAIDIDTWFADLDIDEMFHNYWLGRRACPYAGVDLFILREGDKATLRRGQWSCLMMGLTPSPFLSFKSFLWGEEMIRGDRHQRENPLHWDIVHFNLPASKTYNPKLAL